MSRPEHIPGRPGFFTEAQVKAWRAEYARRRTLIDELAELRTLDDLAAEAGTTRNAMRQLVGGETYKWVR